LAETKPQTFCLRASFLPSPHRVESLPGTARGGVSLGEHICSPLFPPNSQQPYLTQVILGGGEGPVSSGLGSGNLQPFPFPRPAPLSVRLFLFIHSGPKYLRATTWPLSRFGSQGKEGLSSLLALHRKGSGLMLDWPSVVRCRQGFRLVLRDAAPSSLGDSCRPALSMEGDCRGTCA
jgi:hypothetical protein